jgi:lipoprotein-anchoring transpeptidase ErfK/SrfK
MPTTRRKAWTSFIRGAFVGAFTSALLLAGATAASAGIVIAIDKSTQRMSVSVDGVPKYVWPVSTGARGYTTPSGTFTPFRMEPDHYSDEFDSAPMPHSIFFTQQGHAIHGSLSTRTLGQPVSHGCVRLSPANAATLYALVESKGMYNTRVLIQDHMFASSSVAARPVAATAKKKKLSPLWRLYN